MLRINEYDIEPGPYTIDGTGTIVVVTDIVNHAFNPAINLPEILPVAQVVYRDLIPPADAHRSYMVDIEYFRKHFSKK